MEKLSIDELPEEPATFCDGDDAAANSFLVDSRKFNFLQALERGIEPGPALVAAGATTEDLANWCLEPAFSQDFSKASSGSHLTGLGD